MSLINEALRKARQAASEHDDQRNAGRAPQAYPSHGRRRGMSPAAVGLVAVLAGVVGAAGVWWVVGTPATESLSATAPLPHPVPETGTSVQITDPNPTAQPETGSSQPSQQDARPMEPLPAPYPDSASAEVTPDAPGAPPTEIPQERATPVITTSGERVFVMDAELGYASLSLGYIVFRPIRPFAEINGNDVYEGSEVAGFKVEKIEVDRVVLSDDRGTLVLRVP